jgi:putative two-component system response regulator
MTDSQTATVLIVDDEPSSVEALGVVLGNQLRVLLACSGGEALRLAADNRIDLVLMDVDLPDMSGFRCCQLLLAKSKPAPVVLFVSGYSDLVFELQAFEAGGSDYLTKPISPARVMARINRHLGL